jgi:non-ribosomal peptide synthetase component E (peptide arylation enzyme)
MHKYIRMDTTQNEPDKIDDTRIPMETNQPLDANKQIKTNKTLNPSMETNASGKSKGLALVDDIIACSYEKMDNNNKKAADVMKTQGIEAAVQHMFTDQRTGLPLTYAEMRARYG